MWKGRAPTRIRCRCLEGRPSLHPCERCLRPFICTALRQPPPELSSRRFCRGCFNEACEYFRQNTKKNACPKLLQRIKSAVSNDLAQTHGTRAFPAYQQQLESRVKAIWAELEDQALEKEGIIYAWQDSYANDECGDSAQGEWKNQTFHRPS